MSCDPPVAKWACEYCTYENWPSALKCTMCRGPKPLLGEDIYRLRDDSSSSTLISLSCSQNLASGPSQRETTRPHNNGKWECRACTYLNWPRAAHCSQCLTPRPVVTSNLHEHMQPLKIDQKSDLYPQGKGTLRITSPACDRKDTNESENILKTRVPEKSVITIQQMVKWTCSSCTYENWPKSVNCVMCGTPYSGNNADGKNNTSPGYRHGIYGSASVMSSPERDISLLNSARGGVSQTPLIEDNSTIKR